MSTAKFLEFSDRAQLEFPGIAKTAVKPKKRRKKKSPSVGGSCGGGRGRGGRSSRSAKGGDFNFGEKGDLIECVIRSAKFVAFWGRPTVARSFLATYEGVSESQITDEVWDAYISTYNAEIEKKETK